MVEYQPTPVTAIVCIDNGSNVIGGTKVGHATRASFRFSNTSVDTAVFFVSGAKFSSVIGCEIIQEIMSGQSLGEIVFRPFASTWSFQISLTMIEYTFSGTTFANTYSHTFSDTNIPTGSGPQLSARPPWGLGGEVVSEALSTYYGVPTTHLPITTGIRIINRSSLAPLTLTAPGWVVSNGPVNCTVVIEDQPPSSLTTDQESITIFRVTPINPGPFSVKFQLASNDAQSPFIHWVWGIAIEKPRLVILNGTTQFSSYPGITVDAPAGQKKRVTFTLRNEDDVPITFTPGFSSSSFCTPSTENTPSTTLAPGEETLWKITFKPTGSHWGFEPKLELSSPSSETYSWSVSNRLGPDPYVPPPSAASPVNSDKSKCGFGGGISAFIVLGLGFFLALGQARSRYGYRSRS